MKNENKETMLIAVSACMGVAAGWASYSLYFHPLQLHEIQYDATLLKAAAAEVDAGNLANIGKANSFYARNCYGQSHHAIASPAPVKLADGRLILADTAIDTGAYSKCLKHAANFIVTYKLQSDGVLSATSGLGFFGIALGFGFCVMRLPELRRRSVREVGIVPTGPGC